MKRLSASRTPIFCRTSSCIPGTENSAGPPVWSTPDYSEPMKGDLLWVYEGLTQYLGEVLADAHAACTLRRNSATSWPMIAAALDRKSGRNWRPLEDTAVAAQLLYDARDDYAEYRRGVDYYDEGTLIWLDADVTDPAAQQGQEIAERFLPCFRRRSGRRAGAEAVHVRRRRGRVERGAARTIGRGFFASACKPWRRTLLSAGSRTADGSWSTIPSRSDYWQLLRR